MLERLEESLEIAISFQHLADRDSVNKNLPSSIYFSDYFNYLESVKFLRHCL